MRFKKLLFNVAVVAVSAFNVYLVNDIRIMKNELSLLNLENIAESNEILGSEVIYLDGSTGNRLAGDPICCGAALVCNGIYKYWATGYMRVVACDNSHGRPCQPFQKFWYTNIRYHNHY